MAFATCLGWSIAAASGADPTALADQWRSARLIEARPELRRPVAEPVRIEVPGLRVDLEGGTLVPVFSGVFEGEWERRSEALLRALRRQEPEAELPAVGDRGSVELVGLAWSGGTATVALQDVDRGDAWALANSVALGQGGVVDARTRALAAGRGTTGVDRLLWLGPTEQVQAAFQQEGSEDPFEIIVYADTAGDSQAAAATRWVEQRLDAALVAGVPVADHVAARRVALSSGGRAAGYGVVDLHVTESLGRLADYKADPRQLVALYDEGGAFDPRWSSWVGRVLVDNGSVRVERIAGVPHPASVAADAQSAPLPARRLDVVSTEVRVAFAPDGVGWVDARASARITLRAVGGDARHVVLDLPRYDRQPSGSWRVLAARDEHGADLLGRRPLVGGQPVDARDAPPDPDAERAAESQRRPGTQENEGANDEKPSRRTEVDRILERGASVPLFLPEPLREGSQVTLSIDWTDRITAPQDTAGPLRVLPTLPHIVDAATPFRIEVSLPAQGLWSAVLPGRQVAVEGRPGERVVASVSEAVAATPFIAIGRFAAHREGPSDGMPAVSVHLAVGAGEDPAVMAAELRREVSFLQGMLPPYPWTEVDVADLGVRVGAATWVAGPGLVTMERLGTTALMGGASADHPHYAHVLFSHEVAHAWFGHTLRIASREDHWMHEALASLYSCLYVATGFQSDRECSLLVDGWRRTTLAAGSLLVPRWSPTGRAARGMVARYQYAPLVLFGLRRDLGLEAFHGALDVLARERAGQPITTDALRAAFEVASGRDLSAWFDFWIDGGFVPHASADWRREGAIVRGTLKSDVPFGIFEVDVIVADAEGRRSVRATIQDGSGTFELPFRAKVERVWVDQDGVAVLR